MRTCKSCKRELLANCFANHTTGKRYVCKDCVNARHRARYRHDEEYRNKILRGQRQRRHGDSRRALRYRMSIDEIQDMLIEQGQKCALCYVSLEGLTYHVDHDHRCCPRGKNTCGRCTRGILCPRCNLGIGLFEDSVSKFQLAIEYLQRF